MNAWSDYHEPTARRLRSSHPPPPPPDGGGDSGGDSGGGSMSSLDTTSGIAITGGAIFNGLAGGDVDAIENEIDTMD